MREITDAAVNINYNYEDVVAIKDIEDRRLYITCDIDEFIASDIVNSIYQINREDKGIEVENRKPIIIYCTSRGGSVIDGFAIIDAILQSKTPVITVNNAYQYSMGFLIGLAGTKRYGSENSTYLLHDGQNMAWDSSAKVRDQIKFEEKRETRIKDYVISRTNINTKEYDKNYRVEWYMFANEAKEKGVIDGIIGKDISLDEIL